MRVWPCLANSLACHLRASSAVIACVIIRSFDDDTEYELTAAEVKRIEKSKARGNHGKETTIVKIFGFWVYLMTDLVIFAVLFATFVVLANKYIRRALWPRAF